MSALVTLCNQSLALIAKGQIASLGEASIEARECARFATPLLEEMGEWMENWWRLRKRVVLAEVTNDRPAEWNYAYAVPADMATALAVRQVEDDASTLPLGGPFTLPLQDAWALAFMVEGDRIYTNVETATLIYTRSNMDVTDLSALGRKAFVDELAARLGNPVGKFGADQIQALRKQAEVSRSRWMADEENRAPKQEIRFVSAAEYARMGLL